MGDVVYYLGYLQLYFQIFIISQTARRMGQRAKGKELKAEGQGALKLTKFDGSNALKYNPFSIF